MGKNRSASDLTNVIQYDNNGNITFVSGSTTLMQVSSSGAITTTGVISGSNALSASFSLNSALLNGTGSVGFATTGSLLTVSSSQQQISASQQQLSSSFLILTASFNAVSSSQQQISASYIALSASYNTFSGSASTRITENSSSIQQVSASQQQISSSQQQISSSLLNVISIGATTGSNSFRADQSITVLWLLVLLSLRRLWWYRLLLPLLSIQVVQISLAVILIADKYLPVAFFKQVLSQYLTLALE